MRRCARIAFGVGFFAPSTTALTIFFFASAHGARVPSSVRLLVPTL